jgi:hypothetical protein
MPAFSKLDAVNEILTGSGFAPVSSLSSDGPANARIAEQFLDREFRVVMQEGWWFNYQKEVTLTPNASNEIAVPTNVLSLDGPGDDYIALQGKVYSKDGQTFTFTDSIDVDVIYWYEFDEVPFEAQDYATKVALRKFQHVRVGDGGLTQQHRIDERDARARLMQQEGANSDANIRLNPSLREHIRAPRVGMDPDYEY